MRLRSARGSARFARTVRSPTLAALALVALAGTAWAQRPHPANVFIERGVREMRTNPEASRRDADSALEILKREPNPDLEVRARMLLCNYYSERDTAAAREQISVAMPLLAAIRRPGLRAGLLICEGEIFEAAGENASARTQYEHAVAVATDAQDEEMLAEALFLRGYLLGLQGEYAAGLADLRRSQGLFEKHAMPTHALTVLNTIAILYNRMGDYPQAEHIYTRALKAQREAGMHREIAVTLYNLGRAHENQQHWDAAQRSFAESLKITREIGYARGEAYALRGMAAVAIANGDARAALDTLKRAEGLLERLPDARLRGQLQLVRGIALHRLGRLDESQLSLEEALLIFREADSLGELASTQSELAAVHGALGNWRAGFETLREYKKTSDRLLQNQLDQRFASLKVEFDTATKEKENALLLRENEVNNKALEQERRTRKLQAALIVLTALLAGMLATLAVHQRRTTLRMRKLAMTDELTGVPNRRAVLGRLEELLQQESVPASSILIVDMDYFKSINDRYGHAAGDKVLRMVADELRGAVREPAFFGRLGGEEFLIVLPDTAIEEAVKAADRFRESMTTIDVTRFCPERRRISASIGVTTSFASLDTPSTMLQRADNALYAAKRAGRNCVRAEQADGAAPPITPPVTTPVRVPAGVA
jgi:diguanylate cyclase (GGDEF)-like protein